MLKKLKKLNLRLTPRKITQLFYTIIIVISIIILVYISSFIYNNLYKTVTQTENIIYLQERVVIQSINIIKFNEVIEKINAKIKLREKKQLNDIFD